MYRDIVEDLKLIATLFPEEASDAQRIAEEAKRRLQGNTIVQEAIACAIQNCSAQAVQALISVMGSEGGCEELLAYIANDKIEIKLAETIRSGCFTGATLWIEGAEKTIEEYARRHAAGDFFPRLVQAVRRLWAQDERAKQLLRVFFRIVGHKPRPGIYAEIVALVRSFTDRYSIEGHDCFVSDSPRWDVQGTFFVADSSLQQAHDQIQSLAERLQAVAQFNADCDRQLSWPALV